MKKETMKAMIVALKTMHAQCNPRAISKDFAAGTGCSEAVFTGWKDLIEKQLYPVALEWATKQNNQEVPEAELDAAYTKISEVWRTLCEIGEESDIHPHLFIRNTDAAKIGSYAVQYGWSINGTVEAAVTTKRFRQLMESFLGVRMAQNAVLTSTEYDELSKYDSTSVALTKANDKLNGYERNGKTVPGAIAKLNEAETKLESMKEAMKALGVKPEEIEDHPLLTGYKDAVVSASKAISSLKKSIEDAEAYLKEHKNKYDAICAKIAQIQ